MSYATLLLHLDSHPDIDRRIDIATRLARRFEGHLVGMAAADRSLFAMGLSTGFASADVLADAVAKARVAASRRADHFRHRAGALGGSFETVIEPDDEFNALIRRSVCSDLTILGQPDPAWPDAAHARTRLEELVLHDAAPTLVIPHVGDCQTIGNHVLVAWDGSAGAAHAAVGALPFLQRASRVHLVRCDTPVDVVNGAESGELELARDWLTRHGVPVDARLASCGVDVADALLSQVSDLGIDLLVMGAWGRPRWAERMLGGVTRSMLSTMTVPLLMAH
jgi:nucleotide-binding universal stress UspA family protein